MTDNNTKRIAELNDLCRKNIGVMAIRDIPNNKLLQTEGINALPFTAQFAIRQKVQNFDSFTPDNDPYKEHDFGAIEHEGARIFWKIDYYAPDLQHGSEDPADPKQTVRVLTIMLASEY